MGTTVDDKLDAITRLCERHGVAELYLFGSAADGGFVPGKSDYDFLVRFQPEPPNGRYEDYFGLMEDLEALLGGEVDIVEIGAITNPSLRESVAHSRVPLFPA